MKNYCKWLFVVMLLAGTVALNAQTRQIRTLDYQWKFKQGDYPGAEKPAYQTDDWRTLDVPHDWSIESEFSEKIPFGNNSGYLPSGIGWYRKTFMLSKKDLKNTVWVEFDGVYMNSDVWINGHHLGHYPFGYNSFQYSLDQHIKEGTNTLAVRVDNSLQPNSRWYAGAGIYRHVRLALTSQVHFATHGIFVTTPQVESDFAEVVIRTTVENKQVINHSASILSLVTDADGKEIGRIETPLSVVKGTENTLTQSIRLAQPRLWSPDAANLYKLHSTILIKGKVMDDKVTKFGIRKIEFLADKGFLLNGKPLKMFGVGLHHEAGPVGSAVPEAVWIRRFKILKEMGCNAIRTSHNPMAPEFLDLCDSMGFVVMSESFDEWQIKRVEYGYNKYFDQWGTYDLAQMIRRDRNHPSIVLYGVGNEIPDQGKPTGLALLQKLLDVSHTEDPTRPATVALTFAESGNYNASDEFINALDLVAVNYIDRFYPRREVLYTMDKIAHPHWKILGSENSAIYSVRGEYSIGNDPERFIPNYHTSMIDIEYLWKYNLSHDFVMGDFMWTGIDYMGEAKWPNIGPPCGVIDRCGFPKDTYYFYQSIWTKEPMVHLFPHWNWQGREGQVLPLVCYTNCEEVELFVNGKSYGVQIKEFPRMGKTMVMNWATYDTRKHATTSDLHLTWYVPYEPGVVKVVGKNDGKVVSTQEIKTTGAPYAIRMSADKTKIESDKRDVSHLKIEIVDQAGNIVPTADNLVVFTVEGEGKLIGVDNGNPREHNSMKINQRNAFNGLCLAIVQTNGKPGNIRVTANSANLKGAVVNVKTDPF